MPFKIKKNEEQEIWNIEKVNEEGNFVDITVTDLIEMLNKLIEDNPDYADAIVHCGEEGLEAGDVYINRWFDKKYKRGKTINIG